MSFTRSQDLTIGQSVLLSVQSRISSPPSPSLPLSHSPTLSHSLLCLPFSLRCCSEVALCLSRLHKKHKDPPLCASTKTGSRLSLWFMTLLSHNMSSLDGEKTKLRCTGPVHISQKNDLLINAGTIPICQTNKNCSATSFLLYTSVPTLEYGPAK